MRYNNIVSFNTMKITEYLKNKGVSYYKATQLAGKNPATTTANIKEKLIGKNAITFEEYKMFVDKLADHVNDKLAPESFDYEIVTIKLK